MSLWSDVNPVIVLRLKDYGSLLKEFHVGNFNWGIANYLDLATSWLAISTVEMFSKTSRKKVPAVHNGMPRVTVCKTKKATLREITAVCAARAMIVEYSANYAN